MTQLITAIMMFFLILGALDYIIGNRYGLGEEFENGIMASGRLFLCMSGFMVIAPLIARQLGPVIAPAFRMTGADPSAFAGLLLANDAGGAALAMELADTEAAGLFNGLIVGSMMGTNVMLNIPTIMSFAKEDEYPSIIYGLLCGIITIPSGCIAGGLAAGFPLGMILANTLPVMAISTILLFLLLFMGKKIIPAFVIFGKGLVAVAILGLTCGAVESMTGYTIFSGLGTLDTVFPIVGGISIFLAGAFPFLKVVRRIFAASLSRIGRSLRINETGTSALLMALANGIPAIMMLHDMDDRGRILNVAFLSSAACVLGDHLAFTSQVAPELCASVVTGKLVGGVTALAAALIAASKSSESPARPEISCPEIIGQCDSQ